MGKHWSIFTKTLNKGSSWWRVREDLRFVNPDSVDCNYNNNEVEYDSDDSISHHGGHVKEGIGGVDDVEDSVWPDWVLDSVDQKNKATLKQKVQDDNAEKGQFNLAGFSTNASICTHYTCLGVLFSGALDKQTNK